MCRAHQGQQTPEGFKLWLRRSDQPESRNAPYPDSHFLPMLTLNQQETNSRAWVIMHHAGSPGCRGGWDKEQDMP